MNRFLYPLVVVVVALALFQFFFRYEYVHQNNSITYRVDRLTQASCTMPCLPTPPPTPAPTPTPFNQVIAKYDLQDEAENANQIAIALVKANTSAVAIYSDLDSTYKWTGGPSNPFMELAPTKAGEKVFVDPVRIVCDCTKAGVGFRWEVKTASKTVTYINDNADLEKKYGFVQASPNP